MTRHLWTGPKFLSHGRPAVASDLALVFAPLLYFLVAAPLFVWTVAPFQNPDEPSHFLRADNLLHGHLLGHRFAGGTDAGGLASPEIARAAEPFESLRQHPERKVDAGMLARAAIPFGEPPAETSFWNGAIYPPFFYLPSVAALGAAKAAGLEVLAALHLARLAQALASGLCIGAACWLCVDAGASGAALLIACLATLPMSLAMMSAVSQDGPMLGVAALAAATFLRLRLAPRWPGLAGLTLCLALMAMSRPPYAALALLPLLIRVKWTARILSAASVLAAAGLWVALAGSHAGIQLTAQGVDTARQFKLLLDPQRDWYLASNTAAFWGWHYAHEFIGWLGWLDTPLPDWFVGVAWGLLAVVALAGLSVRGWATPGVLAALLAAAFGVFVIIYLTWTRYGLTSIEGVQGRYFLPLAMILAGLGTRLPSFPFGTAVRAAVLLFPALAIAVSVQALVERYYLEP